MRLFAPLIVLASAGYLAYVFFFGSSTVQTVTTPAPAPATTPAPAVASTVPAPEAPAAPAAPEFKSKIVIPDGPPGTKHLAPPGTYYMLERVSVQRPNGVVAVAPGEPVKLLVRDIKKGTVMVTYGELDLEVPEKQVTNDLDLAQQAERKYILGSRANP